MGFIFSNSMIVDGSGGGGGGGGGGLASAITVDTTGMKVITGNNAQTAFEQLDASLAAAQTDIDALETKQAEMETSIKALQIAGAILQTTTDISTTIGATTTVALSALTAMTVGGRTSEKSVGALVYAPDGIIGVVSAIENDNATVMTISAFEAVVLKEFE